MSHDFRTACLLCLKNVPLFVFYMNFVPVFWYLYIYAYSYFTEGRKVE